jgi:hypothetical protein
MASIFLGSIVLIPEQMIPQDHAVNKRFKPEEKAERVRPARRSEHGWTMQLRGLRPLAPGPLRSVIPTDYIRPVPSVCPKANTIARINTTRHRFDLSLRSGSVPVGLVPWLAGVQLALLAWRCSAGGTTDSEYLLGNRFLHVRSCREPGSRAGQ